MDSYFNDRQIDDLDDREDQDWGGRGGLDDSDDEAREDQRDGEPMEYNDLFMQPVKIKAGDMFFKPPKKTSNLSQPSSSPS